MDTKEFKSWRKEQGLSQLQAAELLTTSGARVAQFETGKPIPAWVPEMIRLKGIEIASVARKIIGKPKLITPCHVCGVDIEASNLVTRPVFRHPKDKHGAEMKCPFAGGSWACTLEEWNRRAPS